MSQHNLPADALTMNGSDTDSRQAQTAVSMDPQLPKARSTRLIDRIVALLASSTDYEATLANVAQLVVPDVADWCTVQLLEGDTLKHVAIAHSNPERVSWAKELIDRYPPDP